MWKSLFDITVPNVNMPDVNFTFIQHHFIWWSTQGYVTVFGAFFLPIFYFGIIGYVYTNMRSAVAATVAIIIIMSAMGSVFGFAYGDVLVGFMQIIVALSMSALIVVLLTRLRT